MKLISSTSRIFSTKKVSSDQAVKLLIRNGVYTDEDQIKTILDFLYLIAKTTAKSDTQANIMSPEGDIEHKE
jgi:hypothetical protein